jgi:Ca-activated chloride channel family protein
MTFLWPHALWLLLALPVLPGIYLLLLRRRNRAALRYANLRLLREAIGSLHWTQAHAPPLLFLLGFVVLMLSAARPAIVLMPPSEHGTVILLIDVSLSMAATDVPPTRLTAAKAAMKNFIEAQPRDVRVGIVAFGGYADLVQPPTSNRGELLKKIDELGLQRFTSIGAGLVGALLTLRPDAEAGYESDIFGMGRAPERAAKGRRHKPVPPGSDLTTAIVLVSDGRSTMGLPALKVAETIASHGIRVYTVGVGTLYGGVAAIDGWPPIHADFDEELLQEIADITDAEYFYARTADKLGSIYEKLSRRVVFERKEIEVTAVFAAVGMLLAIASAGLSLVWFNRAA